MFPLPLSVCLSVLSHCSIFNIAVTNILENLKHVYVYIILPKTLKNNKFKVTLLLFNVRVIFVGGRVTAAVLCHFVVPATVRSERL